MKMTNAQIIMNASIELLEAGIIKGTGRMLKAICIDADGNEYEKEVEEPETIHTYQTWKKLGYQVKKGQKAKASFPIWKYVEKKSKDDEEPESKMFMKKAAWFTFEQVEPITQ